VSFADSGSQLPYEGWNDHTVLRETRGQIRPIGLERAADIGDPPCSLIADQPDTGLGLGKSGLDTQQRSEFSFIGKECSHLLVPDESLQQGMWERSCHHGPGS
jgi:hypothetical protein